MRMTHSVDLSTCKKCRTCAGVCPAGIISSGDEARFSPERLHLCIRCGQCMAACPVRAISIEGLSYDRDFFPLPQKLDGMAEAFFNVISTRRSIRSFRDQPVPRELLEKVVDAITFAPPGFTPLTVELTVITDRHLIRGAAPRIAAMYEKLIKMQANPFLRLIFRLMVGKETYEVLAGHVLPLMESRMPALKGGTEDTITRGAPAMILFHAPTRNEDHFIALAFGLLATHSLGLGACAIGLIPPAINRDPELKKMFRVPEKNAVLASMVLGYPKYKYSWGIRRQPASLDWIQ